MIKLDLWDIIGARASNDNPVEPVDFTMPIVSLTPENSIGKHDPQAQAEDDGNSAEAGEAERRD